MRIKRILVFIFLGVVVALALFGANYLRYERQPLPQASAALESNQAVSVTRTPWLTFTPAGPAPVTGFIFYPGGRISYLGYSDLMRAIAEKGYLVVVPKMPLNMAVLDANIADEIIAAHPEIQHWVIGGHSVGGTAAAQYTFSHPGEIAGLAIWSSYPADGSDISGLDIPVLLMYGGNETGVTNESIAVRKHLLPPDTRYFKIEGGDHHQFGSYVLTTEENLATISREEQHAQILAAMLELLQSINER
jgi:pimeloyl-ACP methyl ester carboxylesterase